ncbi:MAG: hypothetical protein WD509_00235 [Candidatus Paceibacterota bacterium]
MLTAEEGASMPSTKDNEESRGLTNLSETPRRARDGEISLGRFLGDTTTTLAGGMGINNLQPRQEMSPGLVLTIKRGLPGFVLVGCREKRRW